MSTCYQARWLVLSWIRPLLSRTWRQAPHSTDTETEGFHPLDQVSLPSFHLLVATSTLLWYFFPGPACWPLTPTTLWPLKPVHLQPCPSCSKLSPTVPGTSPCSANSSVHPAFHSHGSPRAATPSPLLRPGSLLRPMDLCIQALTRYPDVPPSPHTQHTQRLVPPSLLSPHTRSARIPSHRAALSSTEVLGPEAGSHPGSQSASPAHWSQTPQARPSRDLWQLRSPFHSLCLHFSTPPTIYSWTSATGPQAFPHPSARSWLSGDSEAECYDLKIRSGYSFCPWNSSKCQGLQDEGQTRQQAHRKPPLRFSPRPTRVPATPFSPQIPSHPALPTGFSPQDAFSACTVP